MPREDTVSVLVRIPELTHHAIKLMAVDARMSLSEAVRLAIQYAVGSADFRSYMQGMRAAPSSKELGGFRPGEEKQK